jgi:hypothetical protein
MNRISQNFLLIAAIFFLANCNNGNNVSTKKQERVKPIVDPVVARDTEDSVKLTVLVRKFYKWHVKDTMRADGFKPQKRNASDSLYTSIDLDENKKAIEELKETGFFSNDFFDDYRKIAVRMDKELRDGTSIWPDGELPSFNDDVDEWCNCQDYPDNYWDKITLTNIKFNKDDVSFKWTWGDNFYYKAKAKKKDGTWKISHLEGFDMNYYNWEWVAKHKKR